MKYKCPVCGETTLESEGNFDDCSNCGWEDDSINRQDPDYDGGPNGKSLNQAKEEYSSKMKEKSTQMF